MLLASGGGRRGGRTYRFRASGFRDIRFRDLGFRDSGFRGLGSRDLGSRFNCLLFSKYQIKEIGME